MIHRQIQQYIAEDNMEDSLLCHICGNMISHMDSLKRHLGSHNDIKFYCPNCKYNSPRKDALKRHSKTHNRQLLSHLDQRFEMKTIEKTRDQSLPGRSN